jgi:hypothetical protein
MRRATKPIFAGRCNGRGQVVVRGGRIGGKDPGPVHPQKGKKAVVLKGEYSGEKPDKIEVLNKGENVLSLYFRSDATKSQMIESKWKLTVEEHNKMIRNSFWNPGAKGVKATKILGGKKNVPRMFRSIVKRKKSCAWKKRPAC